MTRLYIGTSGWSYQHWKTCFYHGVARKDWLAFYAEHFNSVEINGTFYRLQQASTLQRWFEQTPASFRFALKANRYLTHNKKLLEPARSVLIERTHAAPLRGKLAVVLWQLPKTVADSPDRLQEFLQALARWPEARHAIEFRHPSWFSDETADCLKEANIANCLSDAGGWPLWERVTTDLVYIRLHGNPQTYASRYTRDQLQHWAGRIKAWLHQQKSVHVYFDNDAECAAPFNARELETRLNTINTTDSNG
ncbi:DUF72 domain-containing protein [Methylomarinum vadi]|uniref:DUF72 domain-containing protein n=1 Tax=Methylomarinum vadi TaxID=438855 RepID=UPI0004DF42E9|nr:DUF72 domain-containing protein [Methylomarinum vadi]